MLSVENLAYHYKGRPAVLKDVNFNVNTGAFLAILGNHGVGKSTMLKCLTKILTPDGGKIILDDENLLQMSARQVAQRVAFVAQNVPSTQMTVHDMVDVYKRQVRAARAAAKLRLDRCRHGQEGLRGRHLRPDGPRPCRCV